jgi:hypothetical protein
VKEEIIEDGTSSAFWSCIEIEQSNGPARVISFDDINHWLVQNKCVLWITGGTHFLFKNAFAQKSTK